MCYLRTLCLAAAVTIAAVACTIADYETGDTRYSYLQADFGLLHTTAPSTSDYFLADSRDSIVFSEPATVKWATTADTLYRVLAYHDVATKRLISATPVYMVEIKEPAAGESVPTDPLTIESVWVDGKYLNIIFKVKTGRTDSIESGQKVGLIIDKILYSDIGEQYITLRVTHDQGSAPQYYSVRGYMSTPLPKEMEGAWLKVVANTYSGEKEYDTPRFNAMWRPFP